jgi:hypothetical protein
VEKGGASAEKDMRGKVMLDVVRFRSVGQLNNAVNCQALDEYINYKEMIYREIYHEDHRGARGTSSANPAWLSNMPCFQYCSRAYEEWPQAWEVELLITS